MILRNRNIGGKTSSHIVFTPRTLGLYILNKLYNSREIKYATRKKDCSNFDSLIIRGSIPSFSLRVFRTPALVETFSEKHSDHSILFLRKVRLY